MTKTTVELRERVAERLEISASDMTLSAEDAVKVDKAIEDVTAYLREQGLLWWPDDAIPDACILPMTFLAASIGAGPVGKAGQGHEEGWTKGLLDLSRIKPPATIAPVRASYF